MLETYRGELDKLGELMQARPELTVTLRGYAAPFGTAGGRANLSEARARYCIDYLADNYRLDPERFDIEAFGAEKPPEFASEDWESQRCVELIINQLKPFTAFEY